MTLKIAHGFTACACAKTFPEKLCLINWFQNFIGTLLKSVINQTIITIIYNMYKGIL